MPTLIELKRELYCEIANKRIAYAKDQKEKRNNKKLTGNLELNKAIKEYTSLISYSIMLSAIYL